MAGSLTGIQETWGLDTILLTTKSNLLINPVQELASWSHYSYLSLCPLISGAAIESIPEAYYDGIKDKIRGPTTNYGSGYPDAAFNPGKEGNRSYKIDTFLGGFNQWLTSTSVSYYDYKRYADAGKKKYEEPSVTWSINYYASRNGPVEQFDLGLSLSTTEKDYLILSRTPAPINIGGVSLINKEYFTLSRKELLRIAGMRSLLRQHS